MPIALLATTDKSGIVELGQDLQRMGWSLIATAGTAALLARHGVSVVSAAEWAGTKELLGGRIKTFHPRIFGGLLFRRGNFSDEHEALDNDIPAIELLAGNFYRFEDGVTTGVSSLADALQLIDVGGPAMMRAAAKNHPAVIPLVDPADYCLVVEALRKTRGMPEGVDQPMRLRLAVKAFEHCARYDLAIVGYLAGVATGGGAAGSDMRASGRAQ